MSWEFIRFTTAEKDIQIEYNASGVGVPILKEAAESRDYLFDYEPASNHDIYARSLERAKALPYHEEWEKTIDTYTVEEFERVWIGEATAEEACVRVAERIDAELTA
jgi:ABC-type glycerol-3-phosphate transport system substrate-binding protein